VFVGSVRALGTGYLEAKEKHTLTAWMRFYLKVINYSKCVFLCCSRVVCHYGHHQHGAVSIKVLMIAVITEGLSGEITSGASPRTEEEKVCPSFKFLLRSSSALTSHYSTTLIVYNVRCGCRTRQRQENSQVKK
jgi:hypothetical protein